MSSTQPSEDNKLFQAPEWKLIDDKVVKISDVKVHEFNMGDVEDPDLYALVIDIDDDQENPILFHILIGDKTYWEYLRVKGWEIVK